jgi:hypothetical protein
MQFAIFEMSSVLDIPGFWGIVHAKLWLLVFKYPRKDKFSIFINNLSVSENWLVRFEKTFVLDSFAVLGVLDALAFALVVPHKAFVN